MRLISTITPTANPARRIELLQGDLTTPAPEHPFDLLVVSAFPNDYFPTPSSLIGALYRKGVSVGALARTKEIDLRTFFSCWMSTDVSASGLGFNRILCFEPAVRGSPPDVIGDIFRSLMPILGDHPEISAIAMPLVAAGDQSWPVDKIVTPLIDAAVHWMRIGLPVDVIKIVTHSDAQSLEATKAFQESPFFQRQPIAEGRDDADFDVFISYAHEDKNHAIALEQNLVERLPNIRLFIDRKSISIGKAWQPEIFESIDRCRKLVALLSPAYLRSKVCKEEFNIAWARSRDSDTEILFPMYLYTAPLPTYMKYRNYFDCREADRDRIGKASDELLVYLSDA